MHCRLCGMPSRELRELRRELPVKAWHVVSLALAVSGVWSWMLRATLGEAVAAGVVTVLFVAAVSYRHMYLRYSYYRQSDAEEHRKVVAELGERINMLKVESRERGCWTNDGSIEWDEPTFKEDSQDPPWDFVYLVTLRARTVVQPVRMRIEVEPPANEAKPWWSDHLRAVEDRLELDLQEEGTQIELFHSGRLEAGGEVTIAVLVSSSRVKERGDFEVRSVTRYLDVMPPAAPQSPTPTE